MLTYVVRQLLRGRESLRWPVVEAQVLETRIELKRGRYGGYIPVVHYQYQHRGRTYYGDRIIFSVQDGLANSREAAKQFLDRFEAGMRIPVRVCPTKPALSVIEPGFDPRWWVPLLLALMVVLLGLSVLLEW